MKNVVDELYIDMNKVSSPYGVVKNMIAHSIRVAVTKNVEEPIWHVVNLDTVSFIEEQFHEECSLQNVS